jgi:hypothetical protein
MLTPTGFFSSEVALLTADVEHEPFCSSFVALVSHYLGGAAPSLPKTHLNGVLTASRVLLRYLLNSLDAQNSNASPTVSRLSQVLVMNFEHLMDIPISNSHHHPPPSSIFRLQAQILQLIRCLCRGTIGLHKNDVSTLDTIIKSPDTKIPTFCRTGPDSTTGDSLGTFRVRL